MPSAPSSGANQVHVFFPLELSAWRASLHPIKPSRLSFDVDGN